MADDDKKPVGEMSDGLQVELFHPESDRSPGDTNWQGFGFDVHPIVFPISLVIIVAFIAITIGLGDQATAVYDLLFETVTTTFNWFYIIAVNIFIITVLYFALSKYGNIRIGGVGAEKEFSDFAWMAMLFSAGMGIGLMFFSVAEPMWHLEFVPPAFSGAEAGTAGAASGALATTFFHWGFHPWAVYGLVGLGLAFFSFNRGLPLTFRSVFWPLLGERIYGWPGHVIDLVTVFATLFGLATSLGLGVAQVNTGLDFIASGVVVDAGGVPIGTIPQIILIAVITGIAVMSVAAGLDGGVKRLSTLNLYLMFILLGFMLVIGPTVYILGAFSDGIATYLGNFGSLAFFSGTIVGGTEVAEGYTAGAWMGDWTIFYWSWWIAWSPFVGMFIARISKGRTVREFVIGVLFLPATFSFLWLSTFGGAALNVELAGAGGIASAVFEQGNAIAMFSLFEQFPLTGLTASLATLLVVTFFVTSSDSGSLVIDHLTSGGKHDVPRAQRIFWASTEGAVAAVLLIGGGAAALQTAVITTGLPFAAILLLMCYTVYLGLDNEYQILESEEFAERIEDLTERDDIQVVTDRGEIVKGISEDETTGD